MTKFVSWFVCIKVNYIVRPSQNKKDREIFQMHHFMNPFLQLAVEKKDSKNGAARKLFDPSYFYPTLAFDISEFLDLEFGVHVP